MKLKFPPLSGGVIQGLNDAGIETFEGDYAHYVVREPMRLMEQKHRGLDSSATITPGVINEDAIADMLPDDLPGETNSDSEETDLGGRPTVPPDTKQSEIQKPQVRTPGVGKDGRDTAEGGGGKGETIDPKNGDGKKTGGRMDQTGGDEDGSGAATSPRGQIELRSYQDNSADGAYNLVARASGAHTGDLRIDAVTEDGSPISCPLAAAYDENGNSIAVAGNRITGVSIPADGSLKLRVVLKQPMRVALRASTL